ncbi:26391_t:CDS:2, partial [Racocetra persica]
EVVIDPVETTRRLRKLTKAYLIGVLHDATSTKRTYRIATKNFEFAELLRKGIRELGSANEIIKSKLEKVDYIR